MGRDTIQLETAVSTISFEYLLEFTSEYSIAEELHPELPSPGDRIVDFSKDKVGVHTKFFEFANFRLPISQFLFDILGHYQIHLSKLSMIDVEMDLFNLINAPNLTNVKTETRPRAAHEVPLLISTATHVIAMEDATGLSSSLETPSIETVAPEVPPQENAPTVGVTPEIILEKEVAAMGPLVIKKRREKRAMGQMKMHLLKSSKGATVAGDPDSEKSTSFTSFTGSPSGIYKPGWGVTNSCRLESPDVCQDVVDHIVPPGYFSELRHLRNEDFLNQYNMNLVRQVAKRDQRIQAREEEIKKLDQEIHSLKSADTDVQGLHNQTKDLEALLEAEADMKKATEAKNVELAEELESLRAKFLDLQVNNTQLSQQVSSLQAQLTGEERIKATFKEFKRYEDDKVEQRCAEMDARLDKLSIDFDEELYPHMLTAIAGRRWLIGHGLRLAVLKCAESPEIRQAFADVVSAGLAKGMSEGLQYGIEHGKAGRDLGDVEAYDPEANDKFVKALQDLKDLKYPIVDQLERLKDSPIDLIMASLHLESDTGEDAPQWIRDLRPSSSQLKIPIYPEVCDPKDPWAVKEEISLEDAIAANISRAEKKKKCRVVCRTHGVGSAHHARSDGVAVSVPTAAPQGLAILLTDAATQTEGSEGEVSPRLIRSKSLPPMFNSEWP
ncbi:hypothetical protein Tco_1145815 [Tanacetum coccineum]